MKNILIVDDSSTRAKHAAEFAFLIAQKMKVNIVVANVIGAKDKIKAGKVYAGVAPNEINHPSARLADYLTLLNDRPNDFEPAIIEIDTSGMDEDELVKAIIKNDIWMVAAGVADEAAPATANDGHNLNWNAILNSIQCPLLLIPQSWPLKNIERLVYIADLRYCRLQIVKFLAMLAQSFYADLSIAQLAASGLPHMDEQYAYQLFNDEINTNIAYDQLFFNNIKEQNLNVALDVLINGMHNDMLVVLNHRFHFEEIIGRYITNNLPKNVTVPILIFPY